VERSLGVEHADLLGVSAVGDEEAGDRGHGSARAQKDDANVGELLARELEGIDGAGEGNAGGSLGIIMPNRDIAGVAEIVENLKAVRLGNVLEVDRSEGRLGHLHEVYDLLGVILAVRVAAVHAKRDAVDAAEVLHQEGLALHDAHTAGRGAVAVAEDAGRVGNDRDHVSAASQLEGSVVVVADGGGDVRDAGGIPGVEPVKAEHAGLGENLELTLVELVAFVRKLLQEQGLGLSLLLGRKVVREGFGEIGQVKFELFHLGFLY